ncbi:MAG: stage II sporulation protein M [bacterium]|nr:stage II sporulation protein M [bacterium]
MNLSRFVTLKRESWKDFESSLEEARAFPRLLNHERLESLAFQYRRILHDHALCSARYKGSAAADRLRALALAGTHFLHVDRRSRRISLAQMHSRFTAELGNQRLETIVACLLFLTAGLFGLMTASVHPDLGLQILGPQHVADLQRGELWTDSLTSLVPPSVSSSYIATNNMSVALVAWVGGVAAGLGPLNVCIVNGYMLGAIFAVTHHWSMAPDLGEFVAAHGPLEILLILVSAGAGLRIARALIVAGDGPRPEAIRSAATGSMIVVLGCLPWFVLLGLIEGLISPSQDVGLVFKVTVGLIVMAAFVAFGVTGRMENTDESRA